jgi:hypothetical protein
MDAAIGVRAARITLKLWEAVKMKNKVWTKPKLVVLCKGKTEEAVLQVCKTQHRDGPTGNHCRHGWRICSRINPS